MLTQRRLAPFLPKGDIYIFNRKLQDQEDQYNLLLSLQQEMLSFIQEGVQAKEVYQHMLDFVKERNTELEKHFVKNLGFGVSLAFSYRNVPLT